MKRILCPTDFSTAADHAIAYAAKLCEILGAELTLLNVQAVFSLPIEEVAKGGYLATESGSAKMEHQSLQVMEVFHIHCRSEVMTSGSSLTDVISQRGSEFDLIVMGTNGADDYEQFFFGSRSYQVAKQSSVPVLLVPAGSTYQAISSIAFAFDYEDEEKLPIEQLVDFTTLLNAKINIVQVKNHYNRQTEVYAKQVEERTKMLYNLSDVEFETIYAADVCDSINGYMLKSKTSVLALCSVQHSIIEAVFQKSVIKQLSSTVDYPIFIFHN